MEGDVRQCANCVTVHLVIKKARMFSRLKTLWLETEDPLHDNVLVYPSDVRISETAGQSYIDRNNFAIYFPENGERWLVSKSLDVHDISEFFRLRLNRGRAA
jgi:hypothetical protein